jgi:uncharacterized Zn-finger protein
LFDRPKPTAGCSASGIRRRRRRHREVVRAKDLSASPHTGKCWPDDGPEETETFSHTRVLMVVLRQNGTILFCTYCDPSFRWDEAVICESFLKGKRLIKYVTVLSTVERCLIFCVYLQTHSLRSVSTAEASASHVAYAAQVSVRKSYDDERPYSERLTVRR